jgi:HSP20 family protein
VNPPGVARTKEEPMAENDRNVSLAKGGSAPATEPAGAWGPLASLRREMDRLFDEFGTSRWPVPGAMRLMAEMPPVPAMDLVGHDGGYEITAELPGIDVKDVELRVTGDMLVLKGEKREESERKDKDRHVSERRYGSFQRSLRLPPDADPARIEAICTNGVLKITLPRSEKAREAEKKIEIKGG